MKLADLLPILFSKSLGINADGVRGWLKHNFDIVKTGRQKMLLIVTVAREME